MLAKVVNDDARILDKRGMLGFFASKLAPTVFGRELIRHISVAVYTASDHAALSCAQTNSNKNSARPALVENGRRPAYA
ncbi:transposase [Pseudomonas sp. IT-196MI5]